MSITSLLGLAAQTLDLRASTPPGTLLSVTRFVALLPVLFVPACVDPLSEDDVPPRDVIFDWDPEEYERPTPREVEASSHGWGVDPSIGTTIDDNDGIDDPDDVVRRLSGFSANSRIWYWDFGWSPTFAAPLWKLVNPFSEGDEIVPIDHPLIWDVVPGDTAYSPYWQIYTVAVTDKYAGERIISKRGLDEAIRLGLVLPPQPTDTYANCPVVDEGVRMQVRPDSFPGWEEEPCPGSEETTCIAPHWAYYKGVRVFYFDTNGGLPLQHDEELEVADVYELRRESEALPLSEPVRGVDITGDEDALDTNDVFEATPCVEGYSPVHRTTEVFVAADYASIDTAADETEADVRQVSDLFSGTGVPRAIVRGVEELEGLQNLAVESPPECPRDLGY